MFEKRITRLRESLKEQNLDGLLMTNFYNIFYLTGFKTLTESEREAFVLITKKSSYLFSDARYINILSSRAKGRQTSPKRSDLTDKKIASSADERRLPRNDIETKLITQEKKLIQHLQEIVSDENIRTFGFEGEDLKFTEYLQLKNYLEKVELVATDRLLIRQRAVKDGQEISKIRKAGEISDQCLNSIIRIIELGQSEKEIAWKIEKWLKEKGYGLSFFPIVAIDENSSVPHYDTRAGNNKRVKKNSIILIDFGVKYQDYCSDISRVFFIGKPKTERVNIYNTLLSAQVKTLNYLTMSRSYHSCKDVDEYCRKQLVINNQQLIYPHSTGHGVGLEIHEYPKLSSVSQDILEPNQVFTVEPGVYFAGKWGMRVEDTILIDKDLQPCILTNYPKSLQIFYF